MESNWLRTWYDYIIIMVQFVLHITDTCFCNNSFTVIITDDGNNEDVLHELFYFLLDVCIGPALPPCVCNTSTCRVSCLIIQ